MFCTFTLVLSEVLCYKLKGHGFDSWWCHWKSSLTRSFWSHYGPAVDSASNRYMYQECLLAGLSWLVCRADNFTIFMCCLKIWEPQSPGNLRACPGMYREFSVVKTYILYVLDLKQLVSKHRDLILTRKVYSFHKATAVCTQLPLRNLSAVLRDMLVILFKM